MKKKVRIFKKSDTQVELECQDGRRYWVYYAPEAKMTFFTRVLPPYSYDAAEYIGKNMEEALSSFLGDVELVPTLLPIIRPFELSGFCK